jgi:hypothetical protein
MDLREAFDRVRASLGDESGLVRNGASPSEGRDPTGSPTTREATEGEAKPDPWAPVDEARVNPKGDWSVVVTSHGTYYLTDTAIKCFKVMYEARKKGYFLRADEISNAIDFDVSDRRPDHIFTRCRAWSGKNTKLVGPLLDSRKTRRLYQINF